MALHALRSRRDVPRPRRVGSGAAHESGQADPRAGLHGDARAAANREGLVKDVRAKLERLLGPAAVLPGEAVVVCPANDDEVVEVIRLAAKERWRLSPVGLGLDFPAEVDFLFSTRRITGVVAYEPGDGTLSARAGTRMAELERVTRAAGNHLTPRVAAADRSTLGGVLAEGRSGIDRLRYGPSRHHVLGMRVALADGSVVKSGGRLVKNVTGYDMHRLYCRSLGSLCVVLEVSMRLFAGFEREVLLTVPAHVDRKSTRLNSSHTVISYAVFCLKKKKQKRSTLVSS